MRKYTKKQKLEKIDKTKQFKVILTLHDVVTNSYIDSPLTREQLFDKEEFHRIIEYHREKLQSHVTF